MVAASPRRYKRRWAFHWGITSTLTTPRRKAKARRICGCTATERDAKSWLLSFSTVFPSSFSVPNPERKDQELNTAGHGGDKVRQSVYSHNIDMPPNAPHLQGQSNETGKPPGKSSLKTGKSRID